MTSGWTSVFYGPLREALIVQSKLEAHGIPTLLPNRRVREIDPFITGAGPLSQEVEVPPEAAQEATEILGPHALAARVADPEDAASERDRVACALRWSAIFALLVPVVPSLWGMWLGVRYGGLVRDAGEPEEGHAWNLLALGVCVVMLPVHAVAGGWLTTTWGTR